MKIGLGTVQFGMTYGIANRHGQTSPAEVSHILDAALKAGVQVIDTAFAYGEAECVLGQNDLDKFKIVSKFLLDTANSSPGKQLEQSLMKLNVPSLYGYLAHRPTDLLLKDGCWEQLIELKAEGRVAKIGVSLYSPSELDQLLDRGMIPDLIQIPYNYFDTRFHRYFSDLAGMGCEIHARSVFLQGLFFMSAEELPPFFEPLRPLLRDLKNKYPDDLPQRLQNYVYRNPNIDCLVIGVENLAQLEKNLTWTKSNIGLPPLGDEIEEHLLMPSKWPKLNEK